MKNDGIVYIKEAWATEKQYDHLKPRDIPDTAKIFYLLDGYDPQIMGKKRSPLFLPERFARYFITIKDVRAERTRDISIEDCFAEGIERHTDRGNNIFWYEVAGDYHGKTQAVTPQEAYFKLYNSINGKDAHKANWDWVYSFNRKED